MCCGSPASPDAPVAPLSLEPEVPVDQRWFVVTYFNGESEEAQGLDRVRLLSISPAARATEAAQSAPIGATYAVKL